MLQAAKEAELAAVRARIEAALGAGVSGKRLADLMSLAQFQMLSRDARAFRSPTVVLSMRPLRSVTMRCVPHALAHDGAMYHYNRLRRICVSHTYLQGMSVF